MLWGDEAHVRKLFGDGVASLELTRTWLVERSRAAHVSTATSTRRPSGRQSLALLAGEPDRVAALDREFLAFATRMNRGEAEGPSEYHYEYLLVVARKA